jgi:hypothetical protein
MSFRKKTNTNTVEEVTYEPYAEISGTGRYQYRIYIHYPHGHRKNWTPYRVGYRWTLKGADRYAKRHLARLRALIEHESYVRRVTVGED